MIIAALTAHAAADAAPENTANSDSKTKQGTEDTANELSAPSAANGGGVLKPAFVIMVPRLDLSPGDIQPQIQPSRAYNLSGGVEEKNLAIEWDDWHNRLARAVTPHIFKSIAYSLNVPEGTSTLLHIEITSDMRIKAAQVIRSSGILEFDSMVRDAVYQLDGNNILAFPAGSKRTEVDTDVAFKKGGTNNANYIEFGDVEYREVDSGESMQVPDTQSEHAGTDGSVQSLKHGKHPLWRGK
jgi:hypothetical protein